MKDLRGKVVLITGGARGMGKLWAEKFLQDGAAVILWDKDLQSLEKTKKELDDHYDTIVKIFQVDVTDHTTVKKYADEIQASFGPVRVLVNNAGIVAGGEFTKTPDDKLSLTLDVNLKACIWTMKAFLPGMMKIGEGHIINISSAAGFLGTPYMPVYNASKWGLIGLTESVMLEMRELGYKNIRFTLVCPSYVDTGMFSGVKAPLFTPLLKPEDFIDKAYRAFHRNKYLVLEPFLVKFLPFLRGILPNTLFNFIAGVLGVTSSMKNWKGHK